MVRVRFAPSPTGNVHIGNIRAAIFNWLYARHENGTFVLRIEDTDLERSTPEAIANLLDAMEWLKLDVDEEPLYQTSQRDKHMQAAEKLLADGYAYRYAKGGGGEAVMFRFPWNAEEVPGVKVADTVELELHPDEPVVLDVTGMNYAQKSRKGKPVPQGGCLAGFKDLKLFNEAGECLFELDDATALAILAGEKTVEQAGVTKISFTRRTIEFTDLVKGTLVKPLDSIKDFVIVRSDGSPVFHLANVVDDMTQEISHIIRGDDHVENTYRHLFMFYALGGTAPQYAHLPMIVNKSGKPYSKRDGDAFVGDFRTKGYMADALFNYLTLLGWSPGDDREKMTREEIVEAFSFDRVLQSAAQMDLRKLDNLNGQYIAEMSLDSFVAAVKEYADPAWLDFKGAEYFAKVAALMQIRTKALSGLSGWTSFFVDIPEYEGKPTRKFVAKENVKEGLTAFVEKLDSIDYSPEALETAIAESTETAGLNQGKLNPAVRVAVTGSSAGADLLETLMLLGKEMVVKRIQHTIETHCLQE